MDRRRFLSLGGAVAVAAGGFAAWRFWPDQGLINPCQASLPAELANHELVAAAWDGIDPVKTWDSHAHLVGTGDSGGGIWINPEMESLLHPLQFAQRVFFLNAGCVHEARGEADQSYLERMHNLVDGMRRGHKLLLYAFDAHYSESGRIDWERTAFHVSNDYAASVARRYPDYFEWAASIHPYNPDCVSVLDAAVKAGARAVKWLPAAQGMDPASPLCDRFYEALARHQVPLISHAGEERAVHGANRQELGNPLRLRRALEHGVRVVVAHCASMGEDQDLDRGDNGPVVESFALFARMMEDQRFYGRLFGDISAMTQRNRAGAALARVIERTDWHPRLLNGSDYPLPGVMPLYSVDYMVSLGYIPPAAAAPLTGIRRHNPLLFDFVLKRHLSSGGRRFATSVFETRDFFLTRRPF
jgi:mannonate dehydratase